MTRQGSGNAQGGLGVALVTGGAKRVGHAIVLELARAGYDIALHFRSSKAEAEETAQQVRSSGRRCALIRADLADPGTWSSVINDVISTLGRLDVLVNNASAFDPRPPQQRGHASPQFDPAEWEYLYRVNCTAPAGLCHFAGPHLTSSERGRIINLCDISAESPWPGYLSYCCSKAALVALTRGLARALAPAVTVNGISPGIAEFPIDYSEQLRQKLISQVPLGRAGTPLEVAQLVRYLVESGDYITGQIIAIDGGRTLGPP